MNYTKAWFFIVLWISSSSMQASYMKTVLTIAKQSSQHTTQAILKAKNSLAAKAEQVGLTEQCSKMQEYVSLQSKNLRSKFTSSQVNHTSAERIVHDEHQFSSIAQAAKTQAEQSATASGFLNFPKNTIHTTTNVTHNHHYAQKTWAETFSEWVKNGGQNRALGTGLVIGAAGGYGLNAVITPNPQEKIIVIQAPAASDKNLLQAIAASEIKTS